jgi:hypothetical protein
MRYARIYPWRRTRRFRAPSNGPEGFSLSPSSRGATPPICSDLIYDRDRCYSVRRCLSYKVVGCAHAEYADEPDFRDYMHDCFYRRGHLATAIDPHGSGRRLKYQIEVDEMDKAISDGLNLIYKRDGCSVKGFDEVIDRQPPPDDTTNENPPGDGWSSGEVERGARLSGAPLISMHYLY